MLLNDGEIDRKFEELKKTTGEILDLKAEFTPLVLDSMTKFSNGQTSSVCNINECIILLFFNKFKFGSHQVILFNIRKT